MSSVFSPVSFLVVTYNQEKYIGAAFESALRQEGFPIEIVVTDDHSNDRTFEIVQQMAQEYRGPHKIILNQNPKNLGIVPQVNRAVGLSTGEFIVGMAGDDISLPNRARRSYEEWCKSGKTAHSIFFNCRVIEADGKDTGIPFVASYRRIEKNHYNLTISGGISWEILPADRPESVYGNWVLGASHAFSRESFEVFGPLRMSLPAEDRAIPYRSILLGEVRYVDEIAVMYRRHDSNYWPNGASEEKVGFFKKREMRHEIEAHQQAIRDLAKAGEIGLISQEKAKKIQKRCREVIVNKGLNLAVSDDVPLLGLGRFLRGDLFEENRIQYYATLLKMTAEKIFRLKGLHLLRKLLGRSRHEKRAAQKPVMEKPVMEKPAS